jgi:hypothetical protein
MLKVQLIARIQQIVIMGGFYSLTCLEVIIITFDETLAS